MACSKGGHPIFWKLVGKFVSGLLGNTCNTLSSQIKQGSDSARLCYIWLKSVITGFCCHVDSALAVTITCVLSVVCESH